MAIERVTCTTPCDLDLLVGLSPVDLPSDFHQTDTLGSLRMIAAVVQCWQGMARGSNEDSEQLLLSLVLPG